jgi:hypothetical protein
MRLGGSSQNALHSRRNTGLIGGALEYPRFHSSIGNARLNVSNKHFGNQFRPAQQSAGTAIVEEKRHVVIRIDSRRNDDLDLSLLGDPLNAREITAQPDHSEVNNCIHTARFQLIQSHRRICNALFLSTPACRIVVRDLRVQDEHVLMHQGGAQMRRVDRAANCLDVGHGPKISAMCPQLWRSQVRYRVELKQV